MSLSPSFVLFFIKNNHINWYFITCIVLIYLIASYKIQKSLLYLYTKIGSNNDTLEIKNNEISNGSFIFIPIYTAFYSLILVFLNDFNLFCIIFALTSILTLKIKYIYFSPFLYLLSYSFYWVTSTKNQKYLIISKQKDIKCKKMFSSLVRLNNFSYLDL